MTNIRYVCLSDIHLGQADSILTKLKDGESGIDTENPSPAMTALGDCLKELVNGNKDKSKPILVLAGDIIEQALTSTREQEWSGDKKIAPDYNNSFMVFERFIETVMKEGDELFDKIIFVPGNHDHHLWEIARETQYVKHYLDSTKPKQQLEAPRHFTRMFEKGDEKNENDSWVEAFFMNNLVERYDHLKGLDIRVAYPNMGLHNESNRRCVIFHHGHFTEDIYYMMTEAASIIEPSLSKPMIPSQIEEENFAWIDFFWSAMGRSGKAGSLVGDIYISLSDKRALNKLLDRLADGVLKWLPERFQKCVFMCPLRVFLKPILKLIVQKVAKRERAHAESYHENFLLSAKVMKRFEHYLEGPVFNQLNYEIERRWGEGVRPSEITFVFGHTHKPFEATYSSKEHGSINVFNTGGWVVEDTAVNTKKTAAHGAAAVLLDDELNATSLRLYNEVGASKVGVHDAGSGKNPLTRHVENIINENRTPWNKFSDRVREELGKHKRFLRNRIDRIANME